MTATETWRSALRALLETGAEAAPASLGGDWRGRTTRELLGYQTRIPLAAPILCSPGRRLGHRFMVAEAAWVLSGDNRLSTIAPFARQLEKLSGDGRTMSGAYGPPFVDQEPYVVRALRADPASRQAVATLWRQRPMSDPDTPCTVALQWLVRDGRLHASVYMRSSDAWMGLPYDWFTFSMMTAHVALSLRPQLDVALGELTVTAGSQHLYKLDWDAARACLEEQDDLEAVTALDLAEFAAPDDLTAHLWALARREPASHRFLKEIFS